jgi:glycogen synthase
MGHQIMSREIVRIHNSETGEIVDREMDDIEFAQYQLDQAEQAKKIADAEAKAANKAALLTKLGITADEAKLLLS